MYTIVSVLPPSHSESRPLVCNQTTLSPIYTTPVPVESIYSATTSGRAAIITESRITSMVTY